MGALITLMWYSRGVVLFSLILYFVIVKAVKRAMIEAEKEIIKQD